ncbi:uncharacterized protein LOC126823969 [Patella vulgata]|uniref:uncharacterized protein LOC126823969 n=1 Tax=Patella vulgata TaxID=6465 RepID=UPI0021801F86|nr:uncharacterized protein LOC126823969 [Patella vulgata]
MVLFLNINEGQPVEVLWKGIICRGVVKYKGCVITKKGDWVGVALDERFGDHNGTYIGRRYFQCMDKHGIFVRSNKIRFIPSVRSTYNKYYRVSYDSFIEEPLFDTQKPEVNAPLRLSDKHGHRLGYSVDDMDLGESYTIGRAPRHHQSHAISRRVPAVTMLRPRTAFSYNTKPIHSEYYNQEDFIPQPSIPKAHMPYTALRRQIARGWDNDHYTREMPIDYGRDSMKFSQWNDISA